jgi:glycosyltransferase involved in cell wall biosynthesis
LPNSVLHNILKNATRRFGIEVSVYPSPSRHEKFISLQPEGARRGAVLLSYIIDPFLLPEGVPVSHDHTHHWESWQIAHTFLRKGFAVDVISYLNRRFVPSRRYDYFVAARTNFDRISAHLNEDCVKVAHLDTAHWVFNNHAAYSRLLALQKRRGMTLENLKMIEANWAIENADVATLLGNDFTMQTYRYANTPLYRIPISAPCTYDWDDGKDFEKCRNHYLWFGSSGFVHKGLDLVLEAFAGMPGYSLTVCGPFDEERRFLGAFHQELYETPNIEAHGWIDVSGGDFAAIARRCVGLVYPTCSEGGGGSVITCMHAGLIPILPREASVDIGDGGIVLEQNSIDEIRKSVRKLSALPAAALRKTARRAWEEARARHTRDHFAGSYEKFVEEVLLSGAFRQSAPAWSEPRFAGRRS